ncbi:MAG TPA: hypothetical protein VKB79_05465 [Bryobacteraceae bacterium]|nr:hypothetical protein [Bryobacteraceae bacterium]
MIISRRAQGRAAAVLLAGLFVWFTWRGLIMYFSGDDMMNTYYAWNQNPWRLARAQFLVWVPVYRPLGELIYRISYEVFGFQPRPLYIFCWALLALNAALAYRMFLEVTGIAVLALIAVSLTLAHGQFQDLYLSAGTIYDRLWFLFTVLGIAAYARARRNGKPISWRSGCVITAFCILSMNSKESGVALPVLLGLYELVFVFQWQRRREWIREISPLFAALITLSLLFVRLRVHRTPELVQMAAYQPHVRLSIWLLRVGEYFGRLTYNHLNFTPVTAGIVVALMAIAAGFARNRAMIYGLMFFVVTITPVALIAARPGYVLYVPDLGLGLYFAAALGLIGATAYPALAFLLITAAITWFHIANWPPFYGPEFSPEYRLTTQFRRDYPKLESNSNLLFVNDEYPKVAYDLLFNLRLLYHDKTINVWRMDGPPNQQPDFSRPINYNRVFVNDTGYYKELDNRNAQEAIRLHILKDYAVGREMDMSRRDHSAYVISGLMDGDGSQPSRWIAPHAKFKYDLYPADAVFSMKFWVPDFVAKGDTRSLTISVDGAVIGTIPLSHDGMNEIRLPVAAKLITLNGFTMVGIDVNKPWRDKDGVEYGIVLLRAGFEYASVVTRDTKPINR